LIRDLIRCNRKLSRTSAKVAVNCVHRVEQM
jgi:hypothetical protein